MVWRLLMFESVTAFTSGGDDRARDPDETHPGCSPHAMAPVVGPMEALATAPERTKLQRRLAEHGVEGYAGAARALTVARAPPGVDRVALSKFLLDARSEFFPSPAALVFKHVVYALSHHEGEFADTERKQQYWGLLHVAHSIASQDGALRVPLEIAVAATRALKDGTQEEAEAVARCLVQLPEIHAPLEKRAELVGASLCAAANGWEVVSAAEELVQQYHATQTRCGNAKRVFSCAQKHLLRPVVRLEGTRLGTLAAPIVKKGLFASPASVTEEGSYFRTLYSAIEGAPEEAARMAAVALDGCAEACRDTEETSATATGITNGGLKRKRGEADVSLSSNPTQALPQRVLIPLTLFRNLCQSAIRMLRAASVLDQSVAALAYAEAVLRRGSALELYRPSYDKRTTSTDARKAKKARMPPEKRSKKTAERTTSPPRTSELLQQVCTLVVEAGRAGRTQKRGEDADNSRRVHADERKLEERQHKMAVLGCATLSAALHVSLDAVARSIPEMLDFAGAHAELENKDVSSAAADLIRSVLKAYISIRQLPELLGLISARERCTRLLPIFEQGAVRQAMQDAVQSLPRGQAASCLEALFWEDATADEASRLAFMWSLVCESASAFEHRTIANALEAKIAPLLVRHGPRTAMALTMVRSSVLHTMNVHGMELQDGLFAGTLFAGCGRSPLAASADSDSSSPDSDSSDYDSDTAEARKKRNAFAVSSAGRFLVLFHTEPAGGAVDLHTPAAVATNLRFYAELAQCCAADPLLRVDDPRSADARTRRRLSFTPRAGEDERNRSPLEAAIGRVWALFEHVPPEADDVVRSHQRESGCLPLLSRVEVDRALLHTGANAVALMVRHDVRFSHKGGAVGDRFPRKGFEAFLRRALISETTVAGLWAELVECAHVRERIVGVLEAVLCSGDEDALARALARIEALPRGYLTAEHDASLFALCLDHVHAHAHAHEQSMSARVAARIAAQTAALPDNILSADSVAATVAQLCAFSGTERFLITVATASASDADALRRLVAGLGRPSGTARLTQLAWLARAGTQAMRWADGSADEQSFARAAAVIAATVSAVLRDAQLLISALAPNDRASLLGKVDVLACAADCAELLAEIGVGVKGEDETDASATALRVAVDKECERETPGWTTAATALCASLAHTALCCVSARSCAHAGKLGRSRPVAHDLRLAVALCGGPGDALFARVLRNAREPTAAFFAMTALAASLAWSCSAEDEWRTRGGELLCALTQHRGEDDSASLRAQARLTAARVLLHKLCTGGTNAGRADAVRACRVVVESGRIGGEGNTEAELALAVLGVAASACVRSRRPDVVADALACVDVWARRGSRASTQGVYVPRALLALTRLCSNDATETETVTVTEETLVSTLRIADVFAQQARDAARSRGHASTNTLWCVRALVARALTALGGDSVDVWAAASRVLESAAGACARSPGGAGAGRAVVCAALLADAARSLAVGASPEARRAAQPGVWALVETGIAERAASVLEEDARAVLRALCAEHADSVRYRGEV